MPGERTLSILPHRCFSTAELCRRLWSLRTCERCWPTRVGRMITAVTCRMTVDLIRIRFIITSMLIHWLDGGGFLELADFHSPLKAFLNPLCCLPPHHIPRFLLHHPSHPGAAPQDFHVDDGVGPLVLLGSLAGEFHSPKSIVSATLGRSLDQLACLLVSIIHVHYAYSAAIPGAGRGGVAAQVATLVPLDLGANAAPK